jgi:pyruvate dehydrogenase (quinone)/pyruvate oxidase
MAKNASDVLIETIHDWGVDVVFGIPGDGINGIMEALRIRADRIRFVQTRHEEAAALMACGYAKYTGKLGCCLATSGPGGIHLLNGLYDAKLDLQPVLAITGLQYHDLIGTHTQQDVALDRLFVDVCVFNERVMGKSHVRNIAELACRTALVRRGVAHITVPVDFQEQEEDQPSRRNVPNHVSDVLARSSGSPDPKDLERAAAVLNRGKRIAMIAGAGALGAGELVERAAECLGAPIIKPLLGKGVVPDDSPYTTGPIGLLGTTPSQEALEDCDTLLMVGSSFPYIEYMPEPGQARAVQIDADPVRIGLRYPIEVGIVGDAAKCLSGLLPMLKRNKYRGFLEQAQAGMRDWRRLMEQRGTRKDMPMKPQVVAWELGKRLPQNALVACDSGTAATWWARQILAKRGQKHTISGNLATMACGLPYAIAGAIAYPDRMAVAFVGDGALAMLLAEISTAVRYDLNVKIIVLKNNTLGQIKWEQIVMLGNPEYGCDLQPIDFTLAARACGAEGLFVDDPADIGDVLDRAFAMPGPVLVEAVVDPHEPPMPAKVNAKQAANFAQSLVRGEPYRGKIALTVARDKVRELV